MECGYYNKHFQIAYVPAPIHKDKACVGVLHVAIKVRYMRISSDRFRLSQHFSTSLFLPIQRKEKLPLNVALFIW